MRWAALAPLLPPIQGMAVVELGCGLGAFGARLASRYEGYRGVEPDRLVARPHVEGEGGPQRPGGLHQQPVAVGDLAADVVRQATVGERRVRATLEDDDLRGLVQAPGARRGAHPARDAADDDEPHRTASAD